MGTYGTAVIADTATRAEAEIMLANLKRLAVVTVDRCELLSPHPVSNLWRVAGSIEMSVGEMVGAELFQGVRDARIVVADDLDRAGMVWTAWLVTGAVAAIIYRRYRAALGGRPDPVLAAQDRDDAQAAAALAQLWSVDPLEIDRAATLFTARARDDDRAGTPFAPWFDALGVELPDPISRSQWSRDDTDFTTLHWVTGNCGRHEVNPPSGSAR